MSTKGKEKCAAARPLPEGACVNPELCYHPGWTLEENVCPYCGAMGWGEFLNEKVVARVMHDTSKKFDEETVRLYDPTAPLGSFM